MKKALTLSSILLIVILTLAACGNKTSGQGEATENCIYGPGTSITVIYNSDMSYLKGIPDIVGSNTGTVAYALIDKAPLSEHEIVIGNTSREITEKAYKALSTRIRNEVSLYGENETEAEWDTVGYAIYSDGKSVAIVWSDERIHKDPIWEGHIIEELALDFFAKNYLACKTLVLEEGYVKTEIFSITEYLEERGKKVLGEKWDILEEAIGETYGPEITAALKDLYTIYDNRMVSWYANLYDPGIGGWYWSNSARDNEGYLPSIEETYEALNTVESTGMAELFDNDYTKALPKWLLEDVGNFIYNLQDEDGFFYHPQWPKEYIQANGRQSRITRDIGSAKTILKKLGITPKYDGSTSAASNLTGNLGTSSVVAVSKVVSTATLPQFESVATFKAYLDDFDAQIAKSTDKANTFYSIGNTFQSITGYVNANPEYRRMLIEFFDKHQNQETGLWSDTVCYAATNGIHKIGSVYNSIGGELKHIDKIVDATIEILMFDVETNPAGAGVDIYNAWSCFPYVYANIRARYADKALAEEKVNEIKARIFEIAPEMIENAKIHIIGMKRDDGSFSYSRSGVNSTAQGCPISVPGVVEGNINGTGIANVALVQHIMKALEFEEYMVPFFTEAERVMFVRILNNLQPVIKNTEELGSDITYDFEDIPIGDLPDKFKSVLDAGKNPIEGSFVKVSEEADGNRVIELSAKHRGNDENARNNALSLPVERLSNYPNAAILEFDIKVLDETDKTKAIELCFRGKGSGATIYPMFNYKADGTIELYDYDGDFIATIGKLNEYNRVKIEYYWAEKIYKVYVNGFFRGSGDATYNNTSNHVETTDITFGSSSTINAHYYLDNLRAVLLNKEYTDGALEMLEEKLYSFDGIEELPEDIEILTGTPSVENDENGNGYLRLDSASVKVPTNVRSYIASSAVIEAKLESLATDSRENALTLSLYNEKGVTLWNVSIGIDQNGKYYIHDAKSFKKTETNVSASESTTVKLVYYWNVGNGNCQLVLDVYLGDSGKAIARSLVPFTERYLDALLSYAVFTSGTSVTLDNVKVENNFSEFTPDAIPTVVPGEDSEMLDFEDRNVGNDLPSRINGDAEIGAELDGSNRYLMIADPDKATQKKVTITPYGSSEDATHLFFEFDIEYLQSTFKKLLDFHILGENGENEHVAYLMGCTYSGPAPHIRMYCQNNGSKFSMIDSSPNIVDRGFYLKGERDRSSSTKTTVQIRIDLESGNLTVTYRGQYSYTYENIIDFPVKALRLITGDESASVLAIDNLAARYVNSNAVTDPTPETFEGSYKTEVVTWECTNSNALGLQSSATNLHFDSGISVTYPTGGYTNVHGATAAVLEKNGNKYLNMTAPKRANDRDRAHSLTMFTEYCTFSPNAYVYETDIKLDSVLADGTNSHPSYLQIIFRNQKGAYVQYNMTGKISGKVDLVGIPLANWDEWFTLRLEYHPEAEKIQVYVKNAEGGYDYRGDLDKATTSSSAKDGLLSPAVLAGNIASADINGANTSSAGFSFSVDNTSLSATKLEYNGEQTPVLPEDNDNPGGEGGGTDPDPDVPGGGGGDQPDNPGGGTVTPTPPVVEPDGIVKDENAPDYGDDKPNPGDGEIDENLDEWVR